MSMAWLDEYALDGFFQFGGPLNATRYVIDPNDNRFGRSTDDYWVARFLLDEDIAVIERLRSLIEGPMTHYPILYRMRRRSPAADTTWLMEHQFYKDWLYGMTNEFFDPRYPGPSEGGQALEIAFNRVDNPQIVAGP